jgi:hypothetical protein
MDDMPPCSIDVCPEVTNPGKVGCKLVDIETKFEKIDKILNGTPEHPENGFVHQVLAYLENDKQRHWTRPQKISVAAIVAPLLAGALWYVGTSAYTFIVDMKAVAQEIHEIHRTRVFPQQQPNKQYPTSETQNAHNQQDAGIPSAVERRF